jgi:F-type H+-transporting ATPase subunit b
MEALKTVVFDGLPISFVPWQVLYVMALFAVLVFVLNRVLVRPVLTVLKDRDDQITEGRDAAGDSSERIAERERAIVEKLARARSEAVAKLDAAKKAGEAVRQDAVDAARTKADERLAQAGESLAASAAEAGKSLESEAEHFGRRIASRLLGREVA